MRDHVSKLVDLNRGESIHISNLRFDDPLGMKSEYRVSNRDESMVRSLSFVLSDIL